jgi:aminoglycoside phosphotransferase (APT) family kinase protein
VNDQPLGLTPAVVSELITAQFPDFAGWEVSRFGSGDDHWLFSLGNEWVARFPQRLDRVAWLIREIEILSIASESLASSIPRFERVGEPTESFPYPFVLYRKLQGVGADRTPVQNLPGLAEDLGRLLGKLHRIDPLRIPPTPTNSEGLSWELLRVELIAAADLARPLLPPALLGPAEPYLTGQVPEPIQDGPQRFIHNDICPDHLIVDPDTGRLVGLIDFTDALIGDAVLDFVGLIGIGGYPFIRQVVENYDLVLSETFEEELVWLTRTLTLKWLAQAATNDSDDISKHLSWVNYAFNH